MKIKKFSSLEKNKFSDIRVNTIESLIKKTSKQSYHNSRIFYFKNNLYFTQARI